MENKPGRGEVLLPFAPQGVPYRHSVRHAFMFLEVVVRHTFEGSRAPITPQTVHLLDAGVRNAIRILDAETYGQDVNLLEGTVHGFRSVAFHLEDHQLVATSWIVDEEALTAIALERLDGQALASELSSVQADWEAMLDLIGRIAENGL